MPTFAPLDAACLTNFSHCARLCSIELLEHNCPIAYPVSALIHEKHNRSYGQHHRVRLFLQVSEEVV